MKNHIKKLLDIQANRQKTKRFTIVERLFKAHIKVCGSPFKKLDKKFMAGFRLGLEIRSLLNLSKETRQLLTGEE